MMDALTDPASLGSLGIDAAMVGVVNEATNWLKEQIDGLGLADKLARFFPALPFVAGVGLCALMDPSWSCFRTGIIYGLWATFSFRAFRVSLQGK